ncbi:MAG TPA: protein kinase [Anaeromyxobacteraceae bacterium]|nr:protein kinase [Anaeromyxobacteraceae bacterium]
MARATETLELRDQPPAPPPDPLIGAMVGSFQVRRLLGRGGMGTVYLGEHPVIGSKVAIKFLHESMCASPELVGRFYDEARAVNLIGHENIVATYDLALLPPARYYIVMEFLDGAPLSALLREGRLDRSIGLDILLQLADALRAAHDRGVIHRDLKPDNVFLVQRGHQRHFVKLVDFGIAKLADRQSSSRTAAGVIIGTPEYMAPEQCENGKIDRRTDVYALGVMAYEVATGRLPFTGQAIPQLLLAQLRQLPPRLREVDPTVPASLEAVILKALAKKPEERYQDMASLGAALEEVRRELTAPKAPPRPRGDLVPRPHAPELDVRGPDGRRRRLRPSEVTRGGLFLSDDGALPALFSRVAVLVPREGGAPVELEGEVVRHVAAADAARWHMAQGFALQLGALAPDQRAAVDGLAALLAAPPALTPQPVSVPAPLALTALERRASEGPYELLGARPEEGFPEVRERARAVRRELERLRAGVSPEDQTTRVPALLARVDAAVALLGTAGERLMFDARRGNFQGVAHCVTAGTPASVIEARRQTLLAEEPRRAAEAQRHLARAQVATKLGNFPSALAEFASALRSDPLDLEIHKTYWELKRKVDAK